MGRELQGGILVRAGWAGQGPEELGRLSGRSSWWPPGRVPATEEEGSYTRYLPVHNRSTQSAERPQTHPASSHRRDQDPRIHPKACSPLEQGTARILAATISCIADRWYVSITVEVHCSIPPTNGRSNVVGVDVGIRHLAVLSTGPSFIPNPRALEQRLSKLRRLDRAVARRQPSSKRRARARRQRARMYARAADVRQDALHKLTTRLACEHGAIVVEKLNLAGMLQCEVCALVIDRDLNAAHNLARLAEPVAQSGWATVNARGADRRPAMAGRSAVKREAGTGSGPDQTGTVDV